MSTMTTTLTPIRRNDIDWLRVLAAYGFCIFQVLRVVDPAPGKMELAFDAKTIAFLVSQWSIPLMFFISGWSRKNSMQHLTFMESLRERSFRLVIPFLTGLVILYPALSYSSLITSRQAASEVFKRTSSFEPETLPGMLIGFILGLDPSQWSHLWFLAYLFGFSIVSWPFFAWFLRKKVTPLKTSRVWVYLPLVPLGIIEMIAGQPRLEDIDAYADWCRPVSFFAYFILGFVISRYSALERVLHQEAARAGVLGAGALLLALILSPSVPSEVFTAMVSLASWLIVVGVLGFSKAFLDEPSQSLAYLRESTLPVYVIHQAPIVLIASVVMESTAGPGAKFIVILLASLGTILAAYSFLIRKVSLLRLLFGMKPEKGHTESWKGQTLHRDRG